MLTQIPHDFFAAECASLGFTLPPKGDYGVGYLFMPQDEALRDHYEAVVEGVVAAEGQELLGWRTVPTDNSSLSQSPAIKASEPAHRQVFIGRGERTEAGDAFERRLFILRKVISNAIYEEIEGRRPRLLHRVDVEPHRRLQGHVPRLPARRLLRRPARPALRLAHGADPPALLDEHLPVVEARASLPDGRA